MKYLIKILPNLILCVTSSIFFYSTSLGQKQEYEKLLKQKIQTADSVILIRHYVTGNYGDYQFPDWDKTDKKMNLKKWKALHPKPVYFLENGKVNRKIIREQCVLNNLKKAKLISILLNPLQSKDVEIGKCDEPRHTILIYKKHNVSYIDICFTCLRIHTSKDIHLDEFDFDDKKWVELESFFKSNGLTVVLE